MMSIKHYTDPELLEINTLENAIYMAMQNDVSFMIGLRLSLYEHQSTFNPNLPLRYLFYISDFFVNGKYERAACSYDELEMALQTSDMNRHFVNLIYGIKLKEIEYVFEIDWLNEMLDEHLNSENLFCKYRTRQDEEYYSNKSGNTYYLLDFRK